MVFQQFLVKGEIDKLIPFYDFLAIKSYEKAESKTFYCFKFSVKRSQLLKLMLFSNKKAIKMREF